MLRFYLWGIRCRISLLFPALLTALLLLQPDGVAITCVLASLLHEGGHLLAMLLLSVPPEDCELGAFGLRMRLRGQLSGYGRNLLIALAGPLMNGIAAGVLHLMNASYAAAVHLLLAMMNLLPAAALDGGEIIRCVLGMLGRDSLSVPLLKVTTILTLLLLTLGGIWQFLQEKENPTLLIIGIYLAVATFFSEKNEKTS